MKIAFFAGLALAGAASAQILPGVPARPFSDGSIAGINRGPTLWDQQPSLAANFVDQNFSDFPSFATFVVTDVSFGTAVTITDIITYYTAGFGAWPGAATATLNIFPKVGPDPLAGDDPFSGVSVPVTIGLGSSGALEVHASGLSIGLGAGDYWVGLTPELAFGTFLQEFRYDATTLVGDDSSARNPGGGFGAGTGWFDPDILIGPYGDAAITILGTPAPSGLALLGLGGLVATRRRR